MKIKNSILYVLLAFTTIGSIFLVVRTITLQNELAESNLKKSDLNNVIENYEELSQIDSILLKGEYDAALKSYNESLKIHTENKMGIPMRIALAERLLHETQTNKSVLKNNKEEIDSSKVAVTATPEEIRKYDALNFKLKKTEVQLTQLRRQLKNKSFGAYLKFKSKKGNQLHYVGQVKNGKANGYGIALLDSGSRYEGQWEDNERNGDGTFYWADGQYYVGTYTNDMRSGFGTYYWPNGEKYAGEWQEDMRSGTGKFYGTDGKIVAGEWSDDKLVQMNK